VIHIRVTAFRTQKQFLVSHRLHSDARHDGSAGSYFSGFFCMLKYRRVVDHGIFWSWKNFFEICRREGLQDDTALMVWINIRFNDLIWTTSWILKQKNAKGGIMTGTLCGEFLETCTSRFHAMPIIPNVR
jgi:hypothetical protein